MKDEMRAGALSRREFMKIAGTGGLALLLPRVPVASFQKASRTNVGDSVVLQWNQAALQGVRDSRLGPPLVARALAIVHTAAFDSWAAYDHRAVGTRLGATLRRPPREHNLANKRIAISYAAYRAAADLFPGSVTGVSIR